MCVRVGQQNQRRQKKNLKSKGLFALQQFAQAYEWILEQQHEQIGQREDQNLEAQTVDELQKR